MNALLARLMRKVSSATRNLADLISPPPLPSRHPYQANFDRWFADNGDKTLRLNYKLNPSSVVFDIGGYEGQWASDIFARYGCTIHVFEPVSAFADAIAERFALNPRIKVHKFGLAGSTRQETIGLADNGSSVFADFGAKLPGVSEISFH